MKKKIFIAVLVVSFLLFLWFYYFGINRAQAVKIISESSQQSLISGWDANLSEGYLIAWAKGIRLLKKTFVYEDVKYSTLNGSAQ